MTLDKAYTPAQVEDRIYRLWTDSDSFKPQPNPDHPPYCIVIPPPNITGSLHMGHALDNTLQDVLIRQKRMQGFEALWVPGTDHAGIATQMVVEKELAAEGKSRHDLSRDEFFERLWAWKDKYGRTIVHQLMRLGASLDWSRERFTLDEGLSRAVRTAFCALFEKGYIYRGNYIVNWCPRCHTAISDLEVRYQEYRGHLYYLRYPLESGQGDIVIATTRPETILADTGVAVNPDDKRYRKRVGEAVILPLVGRRLPVVADAAVDPKFGTGALKITPGHDAVDYEVGRRHNLPALMVINREARMTEGAGKYAGLTREECRKAILEDLEAGGYLVKMEEYLHSRAHCDRCEEVLEPFLSEQWFVRMKELAAPAIKVVEEGRVRFVPEKYNRLYLQWMENIRDWCVSRQLVWGHRIPVWNCAACGKSLAYREDPRACSACGSDRITQDPDVLDTWFSSGLWPFSTLGWPDPTADLAYFYPTSVLVTARDIIYLWVARMIMFGLEFMGEVPFSDVFIHATILTREGTRMSKSKGTGIDPLELFDQYGVDATRLGLVFMTEQGQDVRFTKERMEMGRNFANKVWNATRFILAHLEEEAGNARVIPFGRPGGLEPGDSSLNLADVWILGRLGQVTGQVTRALDLYDFSVAAKAVYDFFWDDFCDWYLELSKLELSAAGEEAGRRTQGVLMRVLEDSLALLHPFIPYVTEELWSHLPGSRPLLIRSPWPQAHEEWLEPSAQADMESIQAVIRGIRHLRSELALPPKQRVPIILEYPDPAGRALLELHHQVVEALAGLSAFEIHSTLDNKPHQALSLRNSRFELYLPLAGVVDIEQERTRLERELAKSGQDLEQVRNKLQNRNFITRADPEVVEREQQRCREMEARQSRVRERLAGLGKEVGA